MGGQQSTFRQDRISSGTQGPELDFHWEASHYNTTVSNGNNHNMKNCTIYNLTDSYGAGQCVTWAELWKLNISIKFLSSVFLTRETCILRFFTNKEIKYSPQIVWYSLHVAVRKSWPHAGLKFRYRIQPLSPPNVRHMNFSVTREWKFHSFSVTIQCQQVFISSPTNLKK